MVRGHLTGWITTHTAAALLCSAVVGQVEHPWFLAIRLGLVTGVVTAVGIIVNPYIE